MNIKDKLEKEMNDAGEVVINPATLTEATTGSKPKAENLTDKDTTVKLSDRIKNDRALNTAEKADTTELVVKELIKDKELVAAQDNLLRELIEPDNTTIELSANDKHSFLDSVIANTRFVCGFSLFDGELTGKLRTRTQEESYAIFQRLNRELREGKLDTQLAYSMRLRNMLFAGSIAELNGVAYAELMHPLLPEGKGEEVTEPAWLCQVNQWDKFNDGVMKLIFKELQKFEYKYMTLLDNANTANFWKTELSI